MLLVTGPFKVNGVPLRRVNARYVIATSQRVDLKGVDSATVEKVGQAGYFTAEKKKEKASEEAFFKQGEKPEVRGFGMRPETFIAALHSQTTCTNDANYRRSKLRVREPMTRKLLTRHCCQASRTSSISLSIFEARSVFEKATGHMR